MADINKRLLTASDGIPAPQHKVKGASDFEFTEGSGGAQHTKIVDSSGQPISIDDELKSIKRTQAEILDRLDNGIDTRLTGSIVEETLRENEEISSGSSLLINVDMSNATSFAIGFNLADSSDVNIRGRWRASDRSYVTGAGSNIIVFEEIKYMSTYITDYHEIKTPLLHLFLTNQSDTVIEVEKLYLFKRSV